MAVKDKFYVTVGAFHRGATLHIHARNIPKHMRTGKRGTCCGKCTGTPQIPTNEQILFNKICEDCQRVFDEAEQEGLRAVG